PTSGSWAQPKSSGCWADGPSRRWLEERTTPSVLVATTDSKVAERSRAPFSGLADDGRQALLQLSDQLLVRDVHVGIGQSSLGASIGERVSDAFLVGGDIPAAEHVEQLDRLQVGRLGLFDGLDDGFVGRSFGHEHRYV